MEPSNGRREAPRTFKTARRFYAEELLKNGAHYHLHRMNNGSIQAHVISTTARGTPLTTSLCGTERCMFVKV